MTDDERMHDALLSARVIFCDLLIGRVMRMHAQADLKVALKLEELGLPVEAVNERLASAAHAEWIAVRAEWGQIVWGKRIDRHGQKSEDIP